MNAGEVKLFNEEALFKCLIPSGFKGWLWINWQYIKKNISSVMIVVPEKDWRVK